MTAAPPAPWRSTVDALLWVHPAAPSARDALPAQLAPRAGLPLTIGGLTFYRESPVGPYVELFGSPVMLHGRPLLTHVAFMAVDSHASVAGGRANWALPKILAAFDVRPAQPGSVTAHGDGWELRVTATARARRLPFAMTVRCDQVWPEGEVRRFAVRMRGGARLARVDVAHGDPSIGWLSEGRHLGVLITGTQDVSPPALVATAPDA